MPNSFPLFFLNSSNKIFLKVLSAQISVHSTSAILSLHVAVLPSFSIYKIQDSSFLQEADPACVVVLFRMIFILLGSHTLQSVPPEPGQQCIFSEH